MMKKWDFLKINLNNSIPVKNLKKRYPKKEKLKK